MVCWPVVDTRLRAVMTAYRRRTLLTVTAFLLSAPARQMCMAAALRWILSRTVFQASFISIAISSFAWAQDVSPDDFLFELTMSAWYAGSSGTVQAGGLPIALGSDLSLQNSWTFFGEFSFKPGRRHRLNIEGSPYAFGGVASLSRTITFNEQELLRSRHGVVGCKPHLLLRRYQFDVMSKPAGHLGLEAGAAYLHATGTTRSAATVCLRRAISESVCPWPELNSGNSCCRIDTCRTSTDR